MDDGCLHRHPIITAKIECGNPMHQKMGAGNCIDRKLSSPCSQPSTTVQDSNDQTTWLRSSYTSSVTPNWGAERKTRCVAPLNKAPGPSFSTVFVTQSNGPS